MTTTAKRVLCVQRLRHIPAQFSWIDQRLVFQGHLGRLDAHAAALYLFLLTVADALGLSYWGNARVARLLGVTPVTLARAREDLVRAGLNRLRPSAVPGVGAGRHRGGRAGGAHHGSAQCDAGVTTSVTTSVTTGVADADARQPAGDHRARRRPCPAGATSRSADPFPRRRAR
jgi:hypothetical protein